MARLAPSARPEVLVRKWVPLLGLAVLAFGILSACGGGGDNTPVGDGAEGADNDFTEDNDKLNVATTVAPLTSILIQIGGDRIDIHGLIPDGVDSHTYEPQAVRRRRRSSPAPISSS